MEVATRLALFAAALVVAVAAGWGLGRLTGPLPFLPPSPSELAPFHLPDSSAPHTPQEH
ncbi:MAG TPA: hypothetical protein VF667_01680 [Pseudonocardia sp.]